MGVAGVSAPATRIRPCSPSYHPSVRVYASCSSRGSLRHCFGSSLSEETHCLRDAGDDYFNVTSCSFMRSIRVSGKNCLRGAMTYGRCKFSIPHVQLTSTFHLKVDSFHSMVQSNTCVMSAHTQVSDCSATSKSTYGAFDKMRAEWSRETKRLQSTRRINQICEKYQERIPLKADTSLERDISLLSTVTQNLNVQDYSTNISEKSKDLWGHSQDLQYKVPERLNDVNQISRNCMVNGENSLRLETLPELVTDFTKHKLKFDEVEDDDDTLESTSQLAAKKSLGNTAPRNASVAQMVGHKKTLSHIYDKVLIVDTVLTAKEVVRLLTTKYRNFVHACDTEVANIDVRQETPVDHGDMICFSIYSGPWADFGSGKSCIWVDMLDGENNILNEFIPFFEDPSIKKVWHNYSFDRHIIANYGIGVSGFHADTMHLARLWDSSRGTIGGYSLEALTGDPNVMNGKGSSGNDIDLTTGKISMKDIFGKKKVKKDGTEGKLVTIASVDVLQREERIPWICYSALDSISTLKLFESLKSKLLGIEWRLGGDIKGNMYDFYETYWRPFGNLLVEMEAEGMLVDRAHLSEIEKVATEEQKVAAGKFRNWASRYCADAKYMNVGSDTQIRQLFFGGVANIKNQNESLPYSRSFKVPNTDNLIEEGKKTASKFRNIELHSIVDGMQAEKYTASGWPSVSGDALRTFAGKVSVNDIYVADEYFLADNNEEITYDDNLSLEDTTSSASFENEDISAYGTAYTAFGGGIMGRDACHAIAALCEICSIDSLISNFILPLQGNHISGRSGCIHCSLNINTETGRLSARRPNLQNPPALEKDRYKIREAFVAAPGNSLIVADYGQLELRILAHLSNCKSMLAAFEAGGDFHSRTAMNMYDYIREAVLNKEVLLEWYSQPGEEKPPVPLLKDTFAAERRKAKMLNFSIAYGKTPVGLSRDWKVSVKEAKETVSLWYRDRAEVLKWQEARKKEALKNQCVHTLLGRARHFPSVSMASSAQRGHIERAAINTPVQGSAADVAMCAMLQIAKNDRLRELKWKLLLQVHDEVILEGPSQSAEEAKHIVVECMSKPFDGNNFLKVDLSVDAKCAQSWYAAK